MSLTLRGKDIPLSQIKPRAYCEMMHAERLPTAQTRWVAEGTDFGTDWSKVYALPFQASASTRLQSLQYRITHRYFPTRRFLFIRGVTEDPFCDNCGEVETLSHLFCTCPAVQPFWDALLEIINSRVENGIFTERDILFGGIKSNAVVNMILLVAKQFLIHCRQRDYAPNLRAFRPTLLRAFDTEKASAVKNGKLDHFRERWAPFLQDDTLCL